MKDTTVWVKFGFLEQLKSDISELKNTISNQEGKIKGIEENFK